MSDSSRGFADEHGNLRLYFRQPKPASTCSSDEAWWYAGADGVQVYIHSDGGTRIATISRRQLRTLFKQLSK